MRHPELSYTSPVRFTAAQRVQLALFPPFAKGALQLLCRTCTMRVVGREILEDALKRDGHAVLAIWHETLFMACWGFRNTGGHTLTSYSFDGELAARLVHRVGMEAVRGSSSRGGGEGLRQLVMATRLAPFVGFTLDGPRGPRRVAKHGIALLSARSGLPVIPHAYVAARAWRLNSWDRFAIPKPFTTLTMAYGPPVPPPTSEHPDDVEQTRAAVEEALNRLHAEHGDAA